MRCQDATGLQCIVRYVQCHFMRFSLLFLLIHLPTFYSYDEDNIEKDITFLLYTRENKNPEILRADNTTSINSTSYNGSRQTKILIHGYLDNVQKSANWMKAYKELLHHGDYNIIIVDWFKASINFYPEVVHDVPLVAKKVANLIKYLKANGGAKFEDFHLIGHSLGAQISGFVGNYVSNLGRITGLDPAGPKFQNVSADRHLDRSDANFVDVIHTDIANDVLVGFGTAEVVGHADFYPNGGNNQANCGIVSYLRQTSFRNFLRQTVCDHIRSLTYFIQSIRKCSFVGIKCSDWASFKRGRCGNCQKKGNCALMGYDVNPQSIQLDKPNIFYLKTTEFAPYCSYQYRIRLLLAQPKNASINVSGMYLHLIGSDGELSTSLSSGFTKLKADATHTYLLNSVENLGDIEKLKFLWVNDAHNDLKQRKRKRMKRKKRLSLQEIRVSPLQLNNQERRFCGVKKRPISSNREREFRLC